MSKLKMNVSQLSKSPINNTNSSNKNQSKVHDGQYGLQLDIKNHDPKDNPDHNMEYFNTQSHLSNQSILSILKSTKLNTNAINCSKLRYQQIQSQRTQKKTIILYDSDQNFPHHVPEQIIVNRKQDEEIENQQELINNVRSILRSSLAHSRNNANQSFKNQINSSTQKHQQNYNIINVGQSQQRNNQSQIRYSIQWALNVIKIVFQLRKKPLPKDRLKLVQICIIIQYVIEKKYNLLVKNQHNGLDVKQALLIINSQGYNIQHNVSDQYDSELLNQIAQFFMKIRQELKQNSRRIKFIQYCKEDIDKILDIYQKRQQFFTEVKQITQDYYLARQIQSGRSYQQSNICNSVIRSKVRKN